MDLMAATAWAEECRGEGVSANHFTSQASWGLGETRLAELQNRPTLHVLAKHPWQLTETLY